MCSNDVDKSVPFSPPRLIYFLFFLSQRRSSFPAALIFDLLFIYFFHGTKKSGIHIMYIYNELPNVSCSSIAVVCFVFSS